MTVLTTGKDQTARLWEVASGRELRILKGHEAPVVSVQLSADDATLLTASRQNRALVGDEQRPRVAGSARA
jgi:WD40 repeat protein